MDRIFQLFCGRLASANLKDHKALVFKNMERLDYGRLTDTGFTHVYLLGIFDNRGPLIVGEEEGVDLSNCNDRVPSIFAISNHKQVNPLLGSLDDFMELVSIIHTAGLKVIVDFVPNHTGKANPWLREHPDYYHLEKQEFSGDVITLNYENQKVRAEMTDVLKTIAGWGVDGVRCDMAHLVSDSFWQSAIAEIKSRYPQFTFFAEAYSDSLFDWKPLEDLLTAGFDAVYHEFGYRNLKKMHETGIAGWVNHMKYSLSLPYSNRLINYLSNHDDSTPTACTESYSGWIKLLWLLPQPLLLFNGFLWGHHHRLAHHWLEFLSDKDNELIKLPIWFEEWAKAHRRQATKARLEMVDEILRVQLTFDRENTQFLFNPTKKAVTFAGQTLQPGEAVVI